MLGQPGNSRQHGYLRVILVALPGRSGANLPLPPDIPVVTSQTASSPPPEPSPQPPRLTRDVAAVGLGMATGTAAVNRSNIGTCGRLQGGATP